MATLVGPPLPACVVSVGGSWNTTLQSTMGATALGSAQADRTAWPGYGSASLLGVALRRAGLNVSGVVLTAAPVTAGGVPPPPSPPPPAPPNLLSTLKNDLKQGLDDPKKLAGLIGAVIGGAVLIVTLALCCHFCKKDQQARKERAQKFNEYQGNLTDSPAPMPFSPVRARSLSRGGWARCRRAHEPPLCLLRAHRSLLASARRTRCTARWPRSRCSSSRLSARTSTSTRTWRRRRTASKPAGAARVWERRQSQLPIRERKRDPPVHSDGDFGPPSLSSTMA